MNHAPVFERRRAGVLLHPSSLPDGDFGPDAFRFIDLLADSGTSVWQMLPLSPTHEHGSPYDCLSAHALDSRWLSSLQIAALGWDTSINEKFSRTSNRLSTWFNTLTRTDGADVRARFETFCMNESWWLEDYALFCVLRDRHEGCPWWTWPEVWRDRAPHALDGLRAESAEALTLIRFEQFLLAWQFAELRNYARQRGVHLFGDMPIFVSHDSADVWSHRECFKLDAQGRPLLVAGVPPDYFSATGQRWGNPLYDWDKLQHDNFAWWISRLRTELARFDLLRVDHFRGFQACWEIPAQESTAINGHWALVPGQQLFDRLREHFGKLPLVAEDLGIITPEVTALRERYGWPGMLIMQFAFDGGTNNPYLPFNHHRQAVVYTGTHDNDTTLGWYQSLTTEQQQKINEILDSQESMPHALIHAALNSVAELAIVPMQDILELDGQHRMNTPGVTQGNWRWRFSWEQVRATQWEWWREHVARSGRAT